MKDSGWNGYYVHNTLPLGINIKDLHIYIYIGKRNKQKRRTLSDPNIYHSVHYNRVAYLHT